MKERPILMSTDMVKAILDGRKTQTRRVIKGMPPREDGTQYDQSEIHGPEWFTPAVIDKSGDIQPGDDIFGIYDEYGEWRIKCPYGQPGDRLWVRETWQADCTCNEPECNGVIYRAGYAGKITPGNWKPAIHLPRKYARLFLEITGIRVERVQGISNNDACLEGVDGVLVEAIPGHVGIVDYIKPFSQLWNSINSKRGYSWESNPWVWVIEFKVISANKGG